MFGKPVCLFSISVLLCLANSSSAELVAHWKFDNDRNNSIGLLDWKLENGASFSTDSKEGSHSLSLDGTDDCAVQSAIGVLAKAFNTRTVTFWFKIDSANFTQVLYDEGGIDSGLSVRINAANLQAAVRDAGIDVIISAALNGKSWTHAAVTFDNGLLRLYINGSERAFASAKFTTVARRKDAAGIGVRNSQDAFGKRGTGDYFGGLIDDLRIYDNALSADEIKELAAIRPAKVIIQPEREIPEAEPEKPELPEVSPALDRLLRRNVFYVGPELYSFKYEEPGLMEEEGMFYGVAFGYTYRDWISETPGQVLSYDKKRMARAEGRVAFGEVDYDGALQDLTTGEKTPLSINGIDDLALEGRLLFGADWLGENTLKTLYAGIGYRYLNDDSSFDINGYERESNYYYVPIGFEIDTNLQAGWSWGGRVEFDMLFWGVQKSHFSDLDPMRPDIEKDQDGGYGYRASIKIQHKSEVGIFVIEPFFRYWDIDKSEIVQGWIEPANETTEYGIQLIWMF
ncbi:MAG: LamG domain-containing protein [Sedimentisphaerales bacterium]|nr:LamG domain-containing protein [Sedimentisphaerales bacterium]